MSGSTLDLVSATITGGTLTNQRHARFDRHQRDHRCRHHQHRPDRIDRRCADHRSRRGVTLTNSGTLEANGGELDITSEPVTNTGTLQAIDDLHAEADHHDGDQQRWHRDGRQPDRRWTWRAPPSPAARSSIPARSIRPASARITDVGIANSELDRGRPAASSPSIPAADVTLVNSGTLEANGGELDITSGPVTNTGTLQATDNSILKLTTTTVTNTDGTTSGTVSVDAGSTLDLISAILADGTLTNHGTLNSTGTSAITNVGRHQHRHHRSSTSGDADHRSSRQS